MSSAVRPRRQPSHAAVQANRAALLDAMRERCERGGAKTRPSFGDIVEREGVLSDAGRNAQREGRLRDHAALAAMGRSRHRAGRSRGPRAATAQKERLKRGATVVVPWDMRDQLDKSSEIVAAQVCVCVCLRVAPLPLPLAPSCTADPSAWRAGGARAGVAVAHPGAGEASLGWAGVVGAAGGAGRGAAR
jgi:hypothetical protein